MVRSRKRCAEVMGNTTMHVGLNCNYCIECLPLRRYSVDKIEKCFILKLLLRNKNILLQKIRTYRGKLYVACFSDRQSLRYHTSEYLSIIIWLIQLQIFLKFLFQFPAVFPVSTSRITRTLSYSLCRLFIHSQFKVVDICRAPLYCILIAVR